jgi:hypothetical protein
LGASQKADTWLGDPVVISAERFARERTSYWSQLLPRMEPFVRGMNLSVGRFSPPMAAEVNVERRAFVAELGFVIFRQRVRTGKPLSRSMMNDAVGSVRSLIAGLSDYAEEDVAGPTRLEQQEARGLSARLLEFVQERGAQQLVVDPAIPGCGTIDRAAADLLISRPGFIRPTGSLGQEHLLYEVKTVERPFRAGDLRQVLTYAALMAADQRPPVIVGLVNPRLGTFFECTVDDLCMDVAGVHADELLQQIVFDISAAEISL